MRYCVVKNTATIVDGSDNPDEVMLQNMVGSGFTEDQGEILTEEQYQKRKLLFPDIKVPSLLELENNQIKERVALAEGAITVLMDMSMGL